MSLRKNLNSSGNRVSTDKVEEITPQSPTPKTPDSPAIRVKRRETKELLITYKKDPMFFHPTKLDDILRAAELAETQANSSVEFKSPAPKVK